MPDGLLTMILTSFKTIFAEGVKNLTPYALSLIVSLAVIDMIVSQMRGLLEEKNPLAGVIWNVLKIGLFVFFIENYVNLIDKIQQSFVQIGLIAGGNRITIAVATDPSYVSAMGGKLMDQYIRSPRVRGRNQG